MPVICEIGKPLPYKFLAPNHYNSVDVRHVSALYARRDPGDWT